MRKAKGKKIGLNRETVRHLDGAAALRQAGAAVPTVQTCPTGFTVCHPISCWGTCLCD